MAAINTPIQLCRLSLTQKIYDLKSEFQISRGSKTTAEVIELEGAFIIDGDIHHGKKHVFKAEAVPYARFREDYHSAQKLFREKKLDCPRIISREALQILLPPGALRNALDWLYWQAEACAQNVRPEKLLVENELHKLHSFATISLAEHSVMGDQALECLDFKYLKVKLNNIHIRRSIRAVHEAHPKAKLLLDPNESWDLRTLNEISAWIKERGLPVIIIEQPLKQGADEQLRLYAGEIPLMADESCHTREDIRDILPFYDVFNIKLDKTGGLTEALELMRYLREQRKKVMVGCMVSSSLSILPAFYLAQEADYVDLDGAMFLKDDPYDLMVYENGKCYSATSVRHKEAEQWEEE